MFFGKNSMLLEIGLEVYFLAIWVEEHKSKKYTYNSQWIRKVNVCLTQLFQLSLLPTNHFPTMSYSNSDLTEFKFLYLYHILKEMHSKNSSNEA